MSIQPRAVPPAAYPKAKANYDHKIKGEAAEAPMPPPSAAEMAGMVLTGPELKELLVGSAGRRVIYQDEQDAAQPPLSNLDALRLSLSANGVDMPAPVAQMYNDIELAYGHDVAEAYIKQTLDGLRAAEPQATDTVIKDFIGGFVDPRQVPDDVRAKAQAAIAAVGEASGTAGITGTGPGGTITATDALFSLYAPPPAEQPPDGDAALGSARQAFWGTAAHSGPIAANKAAMQLLTDLSADQYAGMSEIEKIEAQTGMKCPKSFLGRIAFLLAGLSGEKLRDMMDHLTAVNDMDPLGDSATETEKTNQGQEFQVAMQLCSASAGEYQSMCSIASKIMESLIQGQLTIAK